MFKCFKRFFNRKKSNNSLTKKRVFSDRSLFVINRLQYEGLSKVEMVLKACKEFDNHSMTFTSKMIWKYLDGLLDFESVYKAMHYLKRKGVLRKVTIVTSNPEREKYKLFYALNKKEND